MTRNFYTDLICCFGAIAIFIFALFWLANTYSNPFWELGFGLSVFDHQGESDQKRSPNTEVGKLRPAGRMYGPEYIMRPEVDTN